MSRFSYNPQIDGLRGLAVAAVMLYHLHPAWLPGGFTGVDVFFVISGYVVSGSMAGRRSDSFIAFALHFYAKRIRRIVPALLGCLLLIAVLSTLFIPHAWLSSTNQRTGLYAFFGLSNIELIKSGNDYFAPRSEFNPFTHTWSLAVEEQFYLTFPPLFYLWLRFSRRAGLRRFAGIGAFAMLTGLSIALSIVTSSTYPLFAFYSLPTRFWELGAGVLLFQLHEAGRLFARAKVAAELTGMAGLALIALGSVFASVGSFPMPWALLPVFGTLLMLASVAQAEMTTGPLRTILGSPAAVVVGRMSYSLYLWHWPIYVLFRWTIGLHGWLYEATALSLTALIAAASYYTIERVGRYGQLLNRLRPRAVVVAGVACLLLANVSARLIFRAQSSITLSVTRDRQTWYSSADAAEVTRCPTALAERTVEEIRVIELRPRDCADAQPPTLWVIGDSHATAYLTLLRKFSDQEHRHVVIYQQPGCGFLTLLDPPARITPACRQFELGATRNVEDNAIPGDIVFLPSLRVKRLVDQEGDVVRASGLRDDSRVDDERIILDAQRTLRRFLAKGLHVVLQAPLPIFRAPAFRCSDWFNAVNPICASGFVISREFLVTYRQDTMRRLLALQTADVSLWDPFDVLCTTNVCSALDRGGPLFFDADHLSAHGNLVLYESFRAHLRAAGGTPSPRLDDAHVLSQTPR
jgi:peptidoglycan/LPS O-acetylase OafA/YrhL